MKDQFRVIQILHFALLAGSMAVFMVALYLNKFEIDINAGLANLEFFDYIPIGFLPIAIIMSKIYDKLMIKSFNGDGTISSKLNNYKARVIVRSAMLEGAALLAAIIFLMQGNSTLVLVFGVAWLLLFLARPSILEFSRDYKLTEQEVQGFF